MHRAFRAGGGIKQVRPFGAEEVEIGDRKHRLDGAIRPVCSAGATLFSDTAAVPFAASRFRPPIVLPNSKRDRALHQHAQQRIAAPEGHTFQQRLAVLFDQAGKERVDERAVPVAHAGKIEHDLPFIPI